MDAAETDTLGKAPSALRRAPAWGAPGRAGITLLETVLVVVVLGILLALAVPRIDNGLRRAPHRRRERPLLGPGGYLDCRGHGRYRGGHPPADERGNHRDEHPRRPLFRPPRAPLYHRAV